MRNEEKEGTPNINACSMRCYLGNSGVFPLGIMNPKLRGQMLVLGSMQ